MLSSHPEPGATGLRRHRAWLWRLGGLLVSLVALAVVAGSVDVADSAAVLSRADPAWLLMVLVAVAVQLVVRGWRWRTVLPPRPSGVLVPVVRTITPLLVGYLGNAVLPARLGEPVRAFLIARREQLPTLESFGATMLERLVDVVSLALIGLAAAIVLGAPWWIVSAGATVALGGLVVLGLLVAVGFTRLSGIASRVLAHLHLAGRTERLQRWARAFSAGVDRGRDIRRLARVVLLSVVAWALDALIVLLVARSLDIELGYPAAVLIGAVAVLATAIPAAPGYVGTFELAATASATALGVPRAEALALAVLVHAITLIPVALAGAAALMISGSRLGRLAQEAEAVDAVDEPEPGPGAGVAGSADGDALRADTSLRAPVDRGMPT